MHCRRASASGRWMGMGEERSGSAKDVGWAAKRADRRVAYECQRQSQIRMLVCAPVFRNRQVSRLHVLVKRPRPSGPRRPSSGKSSASMIPVAWGLAGPETDWWAPFGSGQLAATAGRMPCSCTQLTTHSSSWGISSSSPQGALNTGMSSTYFMHNGELQHVCFPTLRISFIMITPFLIRLDGTCPHLELTIPTSQPKSRLKS